jgi:methyl-accepting chemotaxis protein
MIKGIQQQTLQATAQMDVGVAEVERGVSEWAKSSEALCEVLATAKEK